MKRKMLFVLSLFILLGSVAIVSAQPYRDCTGVCDLAWSPVEKNLLGAVNEAGLWLYRLNESDPVLFFPHENATSLNFDPKGKYIAVTSCPDVTFPTRICNGTLSLFNIEDQSWEQLAAYEYSIDNVKFSPDGRYVAFQKDEVGAGGGIQLIDLTTNATFSITHQVLASVVIDYAFDTQSNYIALSNGAYGTEGHVFWGISLWRLSDQTLQARTECCILAADLAFTETENSILFVKYDTEISVWNYQTGVIASLNKMNETVGDNLHRLSFSYPPTYLLAALWHPGDRRMLFVWDIQLEKQVFFRDTLEDSFTDLIAINPTGDYVAYSSTVDERKIVDLWEKSTDTNIRMVMSPSDLLLLVDPNFHLQTFPSDLYCENNVGVAPGPTWGEITIGQSHVQDLKHYVDTIESYDVNLQDANRIEFTLNGDLFNESGIPGRIFACLDPETQIVTALQVPVNRLFYLQDLVARYGTPDIVTWGNSNISRTAFWFEEGIAASTYILVQDDVVHYGEIGLLIYFPYQSDQGFETRWPYDEAGTQNPLGGDVGYDPEPSDKQIPFDFDAMIATITTQPPRTPTPTFALQIVTPTAVPTE